jgi:hypothetical protein
LDSSQAGTYARTGGRDLAVSKIKNAVAVATRASEQPVLQGFVGEHRQELSD